MEQTDYIEDLIGDLGNVTIECYNQEELAHIAQKFDGKLTKSQKKVRVREKCLEYKAQVVQKRRKGQKERRKLRIKEHTKHMKEEEKADFRQKQYQIKKDGIDRLKNASEKDETPKIIIDLSYHDQMTTIELKSLSAQINHTVFSLRKMEHPFALHIVNLKDQLTREQLEFRGSNSWGILMHDSPLKESFDDRSVQQIDGEEKKQYSIDWNKTFYLSPDAEETLLEFDDDTNFIIGGLIDRTVIRQASLIKSMQYNIQARKLPLEEMCDDFSVQKKALSINQVVEILGTFRETKDWKQAFEISIPRRLRHEKKKPKGGDDKDDELIDDDIGQLNNDEIDQ